jgi:cell division protein FtsI (penicillin-binding protein 3)
MSTPERPAPVDRWSSLAVIGMTAMLVVMLGRVAQLQLAPGAQLREHMQQRVTRRSVPAPRGDIVDRNGRYLATTEFGYQVFVDPTELPAPPDETIARLSEALGDHAGETGARIIAKMIENQEREARNATLVTQAPPAATSALQAFLNRLRPAAETAPAVTPADEPEAPAQAAEGEDEQDSGALDGPAAGPRKLVRYIRVSDVLEDAKIDAIRALKLPGVHIEMRPVRQYPSGPLAASIIGKVDYANLGQMGAEAAHEKQLTGSSGRILYVRDAMGRPLWMGPDSYESPKRGEDLRLSIDLELQRIGEEELRRGVEECDAAGGRLVIMDPATGEILAMVDIVRPVDAIPFPWPDARPPVKDSKGRPKLLYEPPPQIPRARYIVVKADPARERLAAMARNRCVEDTYEPGSTFKSFVWATVTELGKITPDTVLNTGNGHWTTPYGRPIHDVHRFPKQTWDWVLINSSNIGMSQGADRLSFDQMYSALKRFGFGTRPGTGLQGESAGRVTPRKLWSKYTQTSVSFGQEVSVTPVQMARAFCAFARTGPLGGTLPPARLVAVDDDDPERFVAHRVVRADVAAHVRELLYNVAADMEDKMVTLRKPPESGWRYTMFGKSGTAQIPLSDPPKGKRHLKGFFERQYNASFLAAGPLEEPRLVVLVVIDDPGPELVRTNRYYGSLTAGPVVRRIMERSLAYKGVAPSPPPPKRMVMEGGPRSAAD